MSELCDHQVLQKKYIMEGLDYYEFREIKDKDDLIALSRLTHTTHARKLLLEPSPIQKETSNPASYLLRIYKVSAK